MKGPSLRGGKATLYLTQISTLFSSCRNDSDFLCSYPLPSWVHFSGSPPGPLPLCSQTSRLFIVLLPHVAWETLQWSELPLCGTQDTLICTPCSLLLRKRSPDAWSHYVVKSAWYCVCGKYIYKYMWIGVDYKVLHFVVKVPTINFPYISYMVVLFFPLLGWAGMRLGDKY